MCRGKRYTEQQILDILGQLEAGTPISDPTRLHGVTLTTIYRWKARYGSMSQDKTRKFRQLAAENQRLKMLVADLSLDNAMLKGWSGESGDARQKADGDPTLLRDSFAVSERRVCRMLGFSRTTQRRSSPKKKKDQRLVERLGTLARERPRFGYRRLHLLLGREGVAVNHKRVYPMYRAEGLAVRNRERRKLSPSGHGAVDCRYDYFGRLFRGSDVPGRGIARFSAEQFPIVILPGRCPVVSSPACGECARRVKCGGHTRATDLQLPVQPTVRTTSVTAQ